MAQLYDSQGHYCIHCNIWVRQLHFSSLGTVGTVRKMKTEWLAKVYALFMTFLMLIPPELKIIKKKFAVKGGD